MTGTEDGVGAVEVESKLEKLELEDAAGKVEKPAISFSIWPPSERTRKAVVNRLIENMTADSPISKRLGRVPAEEAAVIARGVEEESFLLAGGDKVVEGDGIEVLQVYSREISKRMLEVLKGRDSSGGGEVDKEGGQREETGSNSGAKEEPSVVNESN